MMKKITLIVMLCTCTISFAQYFHTSFEEPEAIGGDYTDTNDPSVAHDLIDNDGEPFVNFTASGSEQGYSASYVPYDNPGVGLTDGDAVGVTSSTPTGGDPFPDGDHAYQISDVDGNFILEFDPIDSTSDAPMFFIDYFIADTSFEGDGTVNESGDDRIRIYVKDITNNTEHDILNSTGSNINDLGIQGEWITGFSSGLDINGSTFQLVIEVRCNAGTEAFFFDNIIFDGLLGLGDNNQNKFSVYPNPAFNGYVNITSKISGDKNIIVYNILGKQVINTTITGERLDISVLTSGVYILKIKQEGHSSTKKLVVR